MFDWYVYCHYVSTAPEKSCKYHERHRCGIPVEIFLDHAVITNHAHDHPSSVLTSLASMIRVITTTIRAFTLGDQASDRYYLCWRWYHTILWVDSSCDTPKNIMMMMILTCGFLYYRSYPCHAQILLLSNTCDKLILITLHVVMTEFTEFLLV